MLGTNIHAAKVRLAARAYIVLQLLAASSIPALSAGDPVAGQHDFAARCAVCHATAPGESKIGPSLAGVFDGPSGSVTGFNYSAALKSAHLTWDDATLGKWLQNPSGLIHGTTMFVNVPSSDDRQNVIAYLKTLSTDRQTPPTAAQ
jgi:cytochrome c2